MGTKFTNLFYLYITDALSETVKDSQVINWLEILGDQNINTNLLVINTITDFLYKRRLMLTKLKFAEGKIKKGKVYNALILRSKDIIGFSNIFIFFRLLIIFLKPLIRGKSIVVQTRINRNLRSLFFLKYFLKERIRVVYDLRGAAAEEYINKMGYINVEDIDDEIIQKRYFQILRQMSLMISQSDITVCVSKKLKEYVLSKDNSISENKLEYIPGSADSKTFFFDINIRNEFRERHGVVEKLVFLYSGNLRLFWQIPDYLFKIIGLIQNRIPNSFFFILTPDNDIVAKYIQKYSLNTESIYTAFVELDNLNQFLCGADAGLVFRTNVPTNNVASPTKIPEYLLSGLPLVISEGIGDYSGFVSEHGYGLVVNNEDLNYLDSIENTIESLSSQREIISKNSSLFYSKQAHLDKLLNIFEKISPISL